MYCSGCVEDLADRFPTFRHDYCFALVHPEVHHVGLLAGYSVVEIASHIRPKRCIPARDSSSHRLIPTHDQQANAAPTGDQYSLTVVNHSMIKFTSFTNFL